MKGQSPFWVLRTASPCVHPLPDDPLLFAALSLSSPTPIANFPFHPLRKYKIYLNGYCLTPPLVNEGKLSLGADG